MKKLTLLSLFMALLIIAMPICFAAEMNLVYDANGNLVSGDGKYRIYNSLNQLSKIYGGNNTSGTLLEEYWYHPTEERVYKKKVYNSDASLKETVIYASKTFVKVINSTGIYNYTYVYHEGVLIAQHNPEGSKYFIHTDNKGSVVAVTNSTGGLVENRSYDPFGLSPTSAKSRYGYEGKEFSSVVGDMDFNFRKYDPNIHIFTQPDTIIQNVYDPQSLNRYSFERNNPVKNTDPTGHAVCPSGNCVPELGLGYILANAFPVIAVATGVVGLAYGAYYGGNKLREMYPPEQLVTDLTYVYAYASAGPADVLSKMLDNVQKQLEEIQRLKDISDLLKGDLKKEGEETDEPPYDFNFNPPAMIPSTSALEKMGKSLTQSLIPISSNGVKPSNYNRNTPGQIGPYRTSTGGWSTVPTTTLAEYKRTGYIPRKK